MIPEKIPQDFYSRTTDKRLEWWNQLLQSINETISTIKKSIANAVSIATKTSVSKTAAHTILNAETYETYYFTTGSSNITCTLPAVADNTDKKLRIIKDDSGSGYLTIDGNASETINGVTSIVVEKQYCGLELHCTGSAWVITSTIGECEIQTIGSAIELVYTKVFIGGSIGSSSPKQITHGVDYSKIISSVSAVNASSTYFWNYPIDSATYQVQNDVTSSTIDLYFGAFWNNNPYRITIKYYI